MTKLLDVLSHFLFRWLQSIATLKKKKFVFIFSFWGELFSIFPVNCETYFLSNKSYLDLNKRAPIETFFNGFLPLTVVDVIHSTWHTKYINIFVGHLVKVSIQRFLIWKKKQKTVNEIYFRFALICFDLFFVELMGSLSFLAYNSGLCAIFDDWRL